ncbi:MAG TPA: peptide deformylase, partial [Thermomicrobiales bacterium]|nr:peptide deformylase [Thermomicrobiales bacterium]
WTGEVPRSEVVTVKAMDLDNKQIRFKARGWLARVVQHEIDHLDGILFVDRVEDRSTLRKIAEDEDLEDGEPAA